MNLDQFNAAVRRMQSICADEPSSRGLFGRYAPHQPIQRAAIGQFEEQMGCRLPSEYTEFFSTIANGGALGACNLFPFHDAVKDYIHQPFPFDPRTLEPDGDGYSFSEAESFKGCIALSDFGCGSFAVLVVLGEERGKVWEYHGANDSLWRTRNETFLVWLVRKFQVPFDNYEWRVARSAQEKPS